MLLVVVASVTQVAVDGNPRGIGDGQGEQVRIDACSGAFQDAAMQYVGEEDIAEAVLGDKERLYDVGPETVA